jgi:hypothetical protein
MKKNYAIFIMIASGIFVITGTIILWALTIDGPLQLRGVALGAGFGSWLVLAYLIGNKIYSEKKNLLRYITFMIVALVIGSIYHFQWQLPYIRAHRSITGGFEQLGGLAWVCGLTAIYLAYQDYRKASE